MPGKKCSLTLGAYDEGGNNSCTLAEWLSRYANGERAHTPQLNSGALLQISVPPESAPHIDPSTAGDLFSYTMGTADMLALQFDAAVARLESDRIALIRQAIYGTPEGVYLAIEPEAENVKLSLVRLDGLPLQEYFPVVSPRYYDSSRYAEEILSFFEENLPAFLAGAPEQSQQIAGIAVLFEYARVSFPKKLFCESLTREAALSREAYRVFGQTPELDVY